MVTLKLICLSLLENLFCLLSKYFFYYFINLIEFLIKVGQSKAGQLTQNLDSELSTFLLKEDYLNYANPF